MLVFKHEVVSAYDDGIRMVLMRISESVCFNYLAGSVPPFFMP